MQVSFESEHWPDLFGIEPILAEEVRLLPQVAEIWVAERLPDGVLDHLVCGPKRNDAVNVRAARKVIAHLEPHAWLELVLEAMVTPLPDFTPCRPTSVMFSYAPVALRIGAIIRHVGVSVLF